MFERCHHEVAADCQYGASPIEPALSLTHDIQLVTEDVGFLESFCLIGGIPVIMGEFPACSSAKPN